MSTSSTVPPATTDTTIRSHAGLRGLAIRRPVATLLLGCVGFTWAVQVLSLLAGWPLMPAKLAELVVLLASAVTITAWASGRRGVRQLFRGLTTWRFGLGRYAMVLFALPALTVAVASVTGTLETPAEGWLNVALTYAILLVLGAVTGNLWEETVWTGFVQSRLMARRGLLYGSLLTAVPFFLIHLPLAFEVNGWHGTTWTDAGVTWLLLLAAAPFLRYLIGTVFVDTGGSTLAVGLLHASLNAAGASVIIPGGWQNLPALGVLTLAVIAVRRWRGRSATAGTASAARPRPASDRDAARA